MRISPVNNTSFGKLVIANDGGETERVIKEIGNQYGIYKELDKAFERMDKYSGTDEVIFSAEPTRDGNYTDPKYKIKTTQASTGETIDEFNIYRDFFGHIKAVGVPERSHEKVSIFEAIRSLGNLSGLRVSPENYTNLLNKYDVAKNADETNE